MYPGVPPVAVGLPPMLVDWPLQMVLSDPAVAVGFGLTVKVIEAVVVQPLESVTVTV
jgi:hypothetical protein